MWWSKYHNLLSSKNLSYNKCRSQNTKRVGCDHVEGCFFDHLVSEGSEPRRGKDDSLDGFSPSSWHLEGRERGRGEGREHILFPIKKHSFSPFIISTASPSPPPVSPSCLPSPIPHAEQHNAKPL